MVLTILTITAFVAIGGKIAKDKFKKQKVAYCELEEWYNMSIEERRQFFS